jgi:integrase/recombinase XerD
MKNSKYHTINVTNERIKKKYWIYLKEANRHCESTIDNIRKSLLRFEEFLQGKELQFNKKLAIEFKKHLNRYKSRHSKSSLSLSTVNSTTNQLKDFFRWLSHQDGYKRKINILDLEFLSLSNNDIRAAKSSGYKPFPTMEQIGKVLEAMPAKTEIEKRNKALIAFTLLTGMRDGAIISLKIKHIDLEREHVMQDPKEVKTKFRKYIDTFFFPVGEEIKQIFVKWVKFLKEEKLFGYEAPLFPRTELLNDEIDGFIAGGLSCKHWTSATMIRQIFKDAFTNVGIPYFAPHTFRKTLVQLGEQKCKTPEEFKAWSQNLGHESPLTTFNSYGCVQTYRQADIMKSFRVQSKLKDQLGDLAEISKRLDRLEGKV